MAGFAEAALPLAAHAPEEALRGLLAWFPGLVDAAPLLVSGLPPAAVLAAGPADDSMLQHLAMLPERLVG